MSEILSHHDLNKQLRVLLYTYCNIIDSIIHKIREQEKDQIKKDVLTMLIQSVGSSSNTLFKITDAAELSIKDAFIVMRSVIETTINTCLIFSDESYAQKAHKHALQKTARFMKRDKKIGLWNFKTENGMHDDFIKRDDVQEALSEYKERDNWTEENLVQKIEIIEKNLGSCVALSGAYYSIYSEAAELMHGSYFGVINLYGLNRSNSDCIELKFLSVQTEILFNAISCLNSLVELGSKKYSLEKELELSTELLNSVLGKTKTMIESYL